MADMTPEDVPGRIANETGRLLRKLARAVPADQVIVEIGAFKGKSTCFLACGSAEGRGARVISIDPWDTPGNTPGPTKRGPIYIDSSNEADHARHLAACGVAHLVTPVKDFSSNVKLPRRTRIGLLWIDGAHDFDSVMGDAKKFCPLLARGARVVIDDYGAHCKDVDRAVRILQEDLRMWRSWNTSIKPLAIGRRR